MRPRSIAIVALLIASLGSAAPAATASEHRGARLAYHGGSVMRTDTNYLIFWEPPTLQDGSPARVSPTYNALIKRYFRDVGGSGLYENLTQYYEVRNGSKERIQNSSTLGGVWLDTSPYPTSDCVDRYTPKNCVSDKAVRAEIVRAMAANGWTGGGSHLFFVFTALGEGSCVAGRIRAGCAFDPYCAWHNYFRADGSLVVYSIQPYSGTRYSYCGSPDSPNHDPAADATVSLVSHEQMEAVSDPQYRSWFRGDVAQDGEIADVCYTYGPLDEDGGHANQSWNGHYYLVQEEWSNAARACVQDGPSSSAP